MGEYSKGFEGESVCPKADFMSSVNAEKKPGNGFPCLQQPVLKGRGGGRAAVHLLRNRLAVVGTKAQTSLPVETSKAK